MKQLIIGLLLSAPLMLAAQDVHFFQGTWEEVNAKAKAENKPIMVDAYTVWCGPCKMMDKTMFHDNAAVADLLNSSVIPYKIECEHDFGLTFNQKFRVAGYPSLLFFNSDGQLFDRLLGYDDNTANFVSTLKEVLSGDQQDTYGYDAKELSMPWPDFYKQSFRNAEDSTWKYPKDADPNAWLDQQENLLSELSWGVMSRMMVNDKYNEHFKEHFSEYKRLYKKEADNKLQNLLYGQVRQAAADSNEASFQEALELMKKAFPDEPDNAYYLNLYYCQSTGQWDKCAAALQARIDDPDLEVGLGEINSMAWSLYESCEDRKVQEQALTWFDPFLEDMADYPAMDTYAALLFKTGRLDEAEKWAINAIDTGKADNMNVSDTEKLLEMIRQKNR